MYIQSNSKHNKKTQKTPDKQITFVSAFKVSISSNSFTFPAIKMSKSTFHCIYHWNYSSLAISHVITKFYKIWMSSKHPFLTTIHSLLTLPHSGCISTPAPKQLLHESLMTQQSKAQTQSSPHVFPLEEGHTDTSTGEWTYWFMQECGRASPAWCWAKKTKFRKCIISRPVIFLQRQTLWTGTRHVVARARLAMFTGTLGGWGGGEAGVLMELFYLWWSGVAQL